MMDKQRSAELENRTGRFSWLEFKGEPVTDEQGRVSAVRRFGWQPAERSLDGSLWLTGECYEAEAQVYYLPCCDTWVPVEGCAAIMKDALVLPTHVGRKQLRTLERNRRAHRGSRDPIAELRACLARMGCVGLNNKTQWVRHAAKTYGVSERQVWRWLAAGKL
jgi:hypothetical protein